jgi:DNA-binding NtrC family response regulator
MNNTLLQKDDTNSTHFMTKKELNSSEEDFREDKNKKRSFFYHKKIKNKRIIIVDDDEDVLFTYRSFLKDYDYNITCFTNPANALNHIREISNFDDILIILDIRMKNLNGIQLHQQIKAIDPTIKIIFITALDIIDELLSIVPGISKEQIMRKPVDKNLFAHTVKNIFNN